MILGYFDKYMFHEEVSHVVVELLIFFWKHDSYLIHEIDRVRYLCIIQDLDRIVARNFPFYDSHSSFYISYIWLLFEWYTISIVVESATRYILESLSIDESIRDKYYLSCEFRHLGIIECDLLDESLICYIRLQLYSYDFSYIECSR